MYTFFLMFSRYLLEVSTTIYRCVLSVMYAPICEHCRTLLAKPSLFCAACWRRITPIASQIVPLTKTKGLKVFAASKYDAPLKTLVQAKRAHNIIASYQLAEFIWSYSSFKEQDIDYLIPVPLYWYRRMRRGFNQAHEIATGLSQKSGIPVAQLLKRVRHTSYQTECSYAQRIDNVKDAFSLAVEVHSEYIGKRLMLVDDVMTSGSTLYWAARALLPLKPASLSAIVACRALR